MESSSPEMRRTLGTVLNDFAEGAAHLGRWHLADEAARRARSEAVEWEDADAITKADGILQSVQRRMTTGIHRRLVPDSSLDLSRKLVAALRG